MQIQKIYAIHDNAAEAYLAPFFMANDIMAIRAFTSLVNEKGHLFNDSPHDFTLYNLGTWDASNGTITADSGPRAIRSGIALVSKNPGNGQIDAFNTEEKFVEAMESLTREIDPATGDLK